MHELETAEYLNPKLLLANIEPRSWLKHLPEQHPTKILYDLMDKAGVRLCYGINNMSWQPAEDISPTVEVCFHMADTLDIYELISRGYYTDEPGAKTLACVIDEVYPTSDTDDNDTEQRYDYFTVKVSFIFENQPDTTAAVNEVIDIFRKWLANPGKVPLEDLQ